MYPVYETTYDWLKNELTISESTDTLYRVGRHLTHVAGLRVCGSKLVIYKDKKGYCVHCGDEWIEDEKPLLGYYEADLDWDDLLHEIANKYDSIRSQNMIV